METHEAGGQRAIGHRRGREGSHGEGGSRQDQKEEEGPSQEALLRGEEKGRSFECPTGLVLSIDVN